MNALFCRSCGSELSTLFVDLGVQPISNRFKTREQLLKPETFYPLRAFACDACKLVQLQDFGSPEDHFNDDYVYFSSFSSSWMEHARHYSLAMIERFELGPQSHVAEIASNDGYLLKNFVEAGIPALGIDPAANCAAAAKAQYGVETHVGFFGSSVAQYLKKNGAASDLIAANNVLAHVPDINDFIAGFAILLKPQGVATFEFPHLLELIENTQFDTLYHEHYSYLSLTALMPLFARHGLQAFDVAQLPTHGGSLRVFLGLRDAHPVEPSVARLLKLEDEAGLSSMATYAQFADRAASVKRKALALVCELKNEGKSIVGYGAPAKGNTFLNYCGIRTDFLDFTTDRNPAKQGLFLPGTDIPVRGPEAIRQSRPDYVLILPWNLKAEIMKELNFVSEWGGKFIVAIPEARILG